MHHSDLKAADKQQGAPADIFQFHHLAFEWTRNRETAFTCLEGHEKTETSRKKNQEQAAKWEDPSSCVDVNKEELKNVLKHNENKCTGLETTTTKPGVQDNT